MILQFALIVFGIPVLAAAPGVGPREGCVYKGQKYGQGVTWFDGCDFKCTCGNATTGYYMCAQRCLTYETLPPNCVLKLPPNEPCCQIPVCTDGPGAIHTATKPADFTRRGLGGMVSVFPFKAMTGAGATGRRSFQLKPAGRLTRAGTGRIAATAGSQRLEMTAASSSIVRSGLSGMPPGTVHAVFTPGATVQLNMPGCFYKGQTYATDARWLDGCDYDCHCENGDTGYYVCKNRCPIYKALPPGCHLTLPPGEECCKKPDAECLAKLGGATMSATRFTGATTSASGAGTGSATLTGHGKATLVTGNMLRAGTAGQTLTGHTMSGLVRGGAIGTSSLGTGTLNIGATGGKVMSSMSSTAGSGVAGDKLTMGSTNMGGGVAIGSVMGQGCTYKGKLYKTFATWFDGCSFKCRCEDGITGLYRCRNRCLQYESLPPSCSMVLPAGEPCCKVPVCPAGVNVATIKFADGRTAIKTDRVKLASRENMLNTMFNIRTTGTTMVRGCTYKGRMYGDGATWVDGCEYDCRCEDGTTGYYVCKSRCPIYKNLPLGCQLKLPPGEECCRKPDANCLAMTNGGLDLVVSHGLSTISDSAAQSGSGVTGAFGVGGGVTVTGKAGRVTGGTGRGFEIFRREGDLSSVGTIGGIPRSQGLEMSSKAFKVGGSVGLAGTSGTKSTLSGTGMAVGTASGGLTVGGSKRTVGMDSGLLNTNIIGKGLSSGNIFGAGTSSDMKEVRIEPAARAMVSGCTYKGRVYGDGAKWVDGCEYDCRCEDGTTGYYVCKSRCPTYKEVPAGCQLKLPPGEECCLKPDCSAMATVGVGMGGQSGSNVISDSKKGLAKESRAGKAISTSAFMQKGGIAHVGVVGGHTLLVGGQQTVKTRQASGSTGIGGKPTIRLGDKQHTTGMSRGGVGIDTSGIGTLNIGGVLSTFDRASFGNLHRPLSLSEVEAATKPGSIQGLHITASPTMALGCKYKEKTYADGVTWVDGCDYDCRCEDGSTGYYVCKSRCPIYKDLPKGCHMELPPGEECCMKPVCKPVTSTDSGSVFGHVTSVADRGEIATNIIGDKKISGGTTKKQQDAVAGMKASIVKGAADTSSGSGAAGENIFQTGSRTRLSGMPTASITTGSGRIDTSGMGISGSGITTGQLGVIENTRMSAAGAFGKITATDLGSSTVMDASTKDTIRRILTAGIETSTSMGGGCRYQNKVYASGESWFDGCDFECHCVNGDTGQYSCTDRCPTFQLQPGCILVLTPGDACCRIPDCSGAGTAVIDTVPLGPDVHVPDRRAGMTGTTGKMGKGCPYKGTMHGAGDRWFDGCDFECQCLDADNGYYRCRDRCPSYKLKAGCVLVLPVGEPCCKVPDCPDVATIVRPLGISENAITDKVGSGISGPTQIMIDTSRSGSAGRQPTSKIGGSITGTGILARGSSTTDMFGQIPITDSAAIGPTDMGIGCMYKGKLYGSQEKWYDGCDYECQCVEDATGQYMCNDRCPTYQLQPGCVLVLPAGETCCKVPDCSGVIGFVQAGMASAAVATDIASIDIVGKSKGTATEVKKKQAMGQGCVYNGTPYAAGETWYDRCDFECQCLNADTGFYRCRDRCPSYELQPGCVLVLPAGEKCCKVPDCSVIATGAAISGRLGKMDATSGATATMVDIGATVADRFTIDISGSAGAAGKPTMGQGCMYNGKLHGAGESWYDGCDFECQCINGDTGFYKCRDRCQTYQLQPGCVLVLSAGETCCKVPDCSAAGTATGAAMSGTIGKVDVVSGGAATMIDIGSTMVDKSTIGISADMTTGSGGTAGKPTLGQGCMYNGKLYVVGESWYDGCDFMCQCMNSDTGFYKCRDRCPTYKVKAGCVLVFPAGETCCKVPDCSAAGIVTGSIMAGTGGKVDVVSGTASMIDIGASTEGTSSIDILGSMTTGNVGAAGKPTMGQGCLYNGKRYGAGESWYDGCDFECQCLNSDTGFYKCRDRCPTYQLKPGCVLVLPVGETCCKVHDCSATGTATDATMAGTVGKVDVASGAASIVDIGLTATDTSAIDMSGASVGVSAKPTMDKGCLYNDKLYTAGESWYDGCDFMCQCMNGDTGFYKCRDRCPTYQLQPGCVMVLPAGETCCKVPNCSAAAGTATGAGMVGEVAAISGAATMVDIGVRTVDRSTIDISGSMPTGSIGDAGKSNMGQGCLYNGKLYGAGKTWYDGCDLVCQCMDGETGFYKCRDRCPTYKSQPGCVLVLPVGETCCKVPDCSAADIGMDTTMSGMVGTMDAAAGATATMVDIGATTVDRSTLDISGSMAMGSVGAAGKPTMGQGCMYNGKRYGVGESWYDGCDFECQCINGDTGFYKCSDRCPTYQLQPGCVLVLPALETCCKVPDCSASDTATDGAMSGMVGKVVTASGSTATMVDIGATTVGESAIRYISGSAGAAVTPAMGQGCNYNGKPYGAGELWYDGCEFMCQCMDGETGFYKCRDRCPTYKLQPGCVLVLPVGETCCKVPDCSAADIGMDATMSGMAGTMDAAAGARATMVDIGATTVDRSTLDISGSMATGSVGAAGKPTMGQGCMYNGKRYGAGESWYDGCDFECQCINGDTGFYKCSDRCPTYQLQPGCVLMLPTDETCCQVPDCSAVGIGTGSGMVDTVGSVDVVSGAASTGAAMSGMVGKVDAVSGAVAMVDIGVTTVDRSTIDISGSMPMGSVGASGKPTMGQGCLYNGKQYRAGDSWYDGCDFMCQCMDGDTGFYKCRDRCPTYKLQPGCVLVLSVGEECCKVPDCSGVDSGAASADMMGNVVSVSTLDGGIATATEMVGDVFGQIPISGSGTVTGGTVTTSCDYKGALYAPGESWFDGCTLSCKCDKAGTGNIGCVSRCPPMIVAPGCVKVVPLGECCAIADCSGALTDPQITITKTGPQSKTHAAIGDGGMIHIVTAGRTELGGGTVAVQPVITGCEYKGGVYAFGESWLDGCETCICDGAGTGTYICNLRCPSIDVPPGCIEAVPLGECCPIADCSGALIVQPAMVKKAGPTRAPMPSMVNVDGVSRPSDIIAITGGTVATTPVITYCEYKGGLYAIGESWLDGCETCTCDATGTGKSICSLRCPSIDVPPDCVEAVPLGDCCPIADCSGALIGQPAMVKTAVPTTLPGPSIINGVGRTSGTIAITGGTVATKPAIMGCEHKGSVYAFGESWLDGCETCICDVSGTGKSICSMRCPSINVSPGCIEAVPLGECCPIADCSGALIAQPAMVKKTGPTRVPIPSMVNVDWVSRPSGTIATTDGTVATTPVITGCEYKEGVYAIGESWLDGCETCTCDAAGTGKSICNLRCPPIEVPPGCITAVPLGACCPTADCSGAHIGQPALVKKAVPTTLPGPSIINVNGIGRTSGTIAITGGTVATKPAIMGCEYKGSVYAFGESWLDGCETCTCDAAGSGKSICNMRCPSIYVPPGCIEAVPLGECCPIADCSGALIAQPAMIKKAGPNRVPMPSDGVSRLSGTIAITDGTVARTPFIMSCEYKGSMYAIGESWLDGCETCTCDAAVTGKSICNLRCPPIEVPPGCIEAVPLGDCCPIADCSGSRIGQPAMVKMTGPTTLPGPSMINVNGVGRTSGTIAITGGTVATKPAIIGCEYKGSVYAFGESWRDGCETCICDVSGTGKFICNLRPSGTDGTVATTPVITGCEYKGSQYAFGESWLDGCETCACDGSGTGTYICNLRCPPVEVPPGCVEAVPLGECCPIAECSGAFIDQPAVLKNAGPTRVPGPWMINFDGVSRTSGTLAMTGGTVATIPAMRGCEYKGQTYALGESWYDGCEWTCTCDRAGTGQFFCNMRCSPVTIPPGCIAALPPGECCQVADCTGGQTGHIGAIPGGMMPETGYALPIGSGTQSANFATGDTFGFNMAASQQTRPVVKSMATGTIGQGVLKGCDYMGIIVAAGQSWDDECAWTCTCDSTGTGEVTCVDRCPPVDVPPGCTETQQPGECCKVVDCSGVNMNTGSAYIPTQGHPQSLENTKAGDGYSVDTGGINVATDKVEINVSIHPSANVETVRHRAANPSDLSNLRGVSELVELPGVNTGTGVTSVEYPTGYPGATVHIPNARPTGNTGYQDYVPQTNDAVKTSDPIEDLHSKPGVATTVGEHTPIVYPTGLIGTSNGVLSSGATSSPIIIDSVVGHAVNTPSSPILTVQDVSSFKPGCDYMGMMVPAGQSWDDGCVWTCTCDGNGTGKVTCVERCPPVEVPQGCTEIQQPGECCKVVDCSGVNTRTENAYTSTQGHPQSLAMALTGIYISADTGRTHVSNDRLVEMNVPIKHPNTNTKTVKHMEATPSYLSNLRDANDITELSGVNIGTVNNVSPVEYAIANRSEWVHTPDARSSGHIESSDYVPQRSSTIKTSRPTDELLGNQDTAYILGVRTPSVYPGENIGILNTASTSGRTISTINTGNVGGYKTNTQSSPIPVSRAVSPLMQGCDYMGMMVPAGQSWDDGCVWTCTCDGNGTGKFTCVDRCPPVFVPPECVEILPPGECCKILDCSAGAIRNTAHGSSGSTNSLSGGYTFGLPPIVDVSSVTSTTVTDSYSGNDVQTAGTLYGQHMDIATSETSSERPGVALDISNLHGWNSAYKQSVAGNDNVKVINIADVVGVDIPSKQSGVYIENTTTTMKGNIKNGTIQGVNYPNPQYNENIDNVATKGGNGGIVDVLRPSYLHIQQSSTLETGRPLTSTGDSIGTGRTQGLGYHNNQPVLNTQSLQNARYAAPKQDYAGIGYVNDYLRNPSLSIEPGARGPSETGFKGKLNINDIGSAQIAETRQRVGQNQYSGCAYMGMMVAAGQSWYDGCAWSCTCDAMGTGKYTCVERCTPVQLPPGCVEILPPGECCKIADCSNLNMSPGLPMQVDGTIPISQGSVASIDTLGVTTGGESSIITGVGADMSSMDNSIDTTYVIADLQNQKAPVTTGIATPEPPAGILKGLSKSIKVGKQVGHDCLYGGRIYLPGQSWTNGCEWSCQCDDAGTGVYSCTDLCPTYKLEPGCVMVLPPGEKCCQVPDCSNINTGMVAIPTSTDTGIDPIVSSDPMTKGRCVYKSAEYRTDDSWFDGCSYKCTCSDETTGSYYCTHRCPTYPHNPIGCDMKLAAGEQCCPTPDCSNVYATMKMAMVGRGCLYKGKRYQPDEVWTDGCDLICQCDIAQTDIYRCQETCPRYDYPADGCTLKLPPGERCCLQPECSGLFPPGSTKIDQVSIATAHITPVGSVGSAGTVGIVGGVGGVGSVGNLGLFRGIRGSGTVGVTGADWRVGELGAAASRTSMSTVTGQGKATMWSGCVYKGVIYIAGGTWYDGCDYRCECINADTGEYKCQDRCPIYTEVPIGCVLKLPPGEKCCRKPDCTGSMQTQNVEGSTIQGTINILGAGVASSGGMGVRSGTVVTGTGGPNFVKRTHVGRRPRKDKPDVHGTIKATGTGVAFQRGVVGRSDVTNVGDGSVMQPGLGMPFTTATEQFQQGTRTTGCTYRGKTYLTGDVWNDGCDYECVCENADSGFYRCHERCPGFVNLPNGCVMVLPPGEECCKRPDCSGQYGVSGAKTAVVTNIVDSNIPLVKTGGISTGTGTVRGSVIGGSPMMSEKVRSAVFDTVVRGPGKATVDTGLGVDVSSTIDSAVHGGGISDGIGLHARTNVHDTRVNLHGSNIGMTGESMSTNVGMSGRRFGILETEFVGQRTGMPDRVKTSSGRLFGKSEERLGQRPQTSLKISGERTRMSAEMRGTRNGLTDRVKMSSGRGGSEEETSRRRMSADLRGTRDGVSGRVKTSSGRGRSEEKKSRGHRISSNMADTRTGMSKQVRGQRVGMSDRERDSSRRQFGRSEEESGQRRTASRKMTGKLSGDRIVMTGRMASLRGGKSDSAIHSTGRLEDGPHPRRQQSTTTTDKHIAMSGEMTGRRTGKSDGVKDRRPGRRQSGRSKEGSTRRRQKATDEHLIIPIDTNILRSEKINKVLDQSGRQHGRSKDESTRRHDRRTGISTGRKNVHGGIVDRVAGSSGRLFGLSQERSVMGKQRSGSGIKISDRVKQPSGKRGSLLDSVGTTSGETHVWANGGGGMLRGRTDSVDGGIIRDSGSHVRSDSDMGIANRVATDVNVSSKRTIVIKYDTSIPQLERHVLIKSSDGSESENVRKDTRGVKKESGFRTTDKTRATAKGMSSIAQTKTSESSKDVSSGLATDTFGTKSDPVLPQFGRSGTGTVIQELAAPITASGGAAMAEQLHFGTLNIASGSTMDGTMTSGQMGGGCVYKDRTYEQDATWYDGCESQCFCLNAATGYYRCTSRCRMYTEIPTGCVLNLPAGEECCKQLDCSGAHLSRGLMGGAGIDVSNGVDVSGSGTSGGSISRTGGASITVTAGVSGVVGGPMGVGCLYNGNVHADNTTWYDGCDYECHCENGQSGFYRCKNRCPIYTNVPAGCSLTLPPGEECCNVLECPDMQQGTPSESQGSAQVSRSVFLHRRGDGGKQRHTPIIENTNLHKGVGVIETNASPHVPAAPFPGGKCFYKGMRYAQDEQWYDGCDYTCRCENAHIGFYRCRNRCPIYTSYPPGCVMRTPPGECCGVLNCPEQTPGSPDITDAEGQTMTSHIKVTGDGASKVAMTNVATHVGIEGREVRQQPIMVGMVGGSTSTQISGGNKVETVGTDKRTGGGIVSISSVKTATTATMISDVGTGGGTGVGMGGGVGGGDGGGTEQCEYNGKYYDTGATWEDGCSYRCVCENGRTGKYFCTNSFKVHDHVVTTTTTTTTSPTPKCPIFTQIPTGCTLKLPPGEKCCERLECPKIQVANPGLRATANMLNVQRGGATVSRRNKASGFRSMIPIHG